MLVLVPAKHGMGRQSVSVPRARRTGRTAWDAGVSGVQGHGLPDTGAALSVVPLWPLRRLGTPVSEKTKRVMYSVSGMFEAYNADIAAEMQHDNRWLGTGTIKADAPDTAWSRDSNSRLPLLLGLDGFFSRFDVWISHSKKSFCLGGVGDWAKDGMV